LRGEIREQAEREAQLIVREAKAQAEQGLLQVREEVRRAQDEMQQLWRIRRGYLAQLRTVVERQLSELVAAEANPLPRASRRAKAARRSARQCNRRPLRGGR
jgi:flagellar biosynthesis/type III secretory pathway protein FliH